MPRARKQHKPADAHFSARRSAANPGSLIARTAQQDSRSSAFYATRMDNLGVRRWSQAFPEFFVDPQTCFQQIQQIAADAAMLGARTLSDLGGLRRRAPNMQGGAIRHRA